MSGLGAPRFTATPMPDDMMSARLSASELAGLDQIVDLEIHQHGEIERLARLDPPLHHRGDVGDHDGLEARRLLELRPKLANDHFGHPRAEDFQLGTAPCSPAASQHRGEQSQRQHRVIPCVASNFLQLAIPASRT